MLVNRHEGCKPAAKPMQGSSVTVCRYTEDYWKHERVIFMKVLSLKNI